MHPATYLTLETKLGWLAALYTAVKDFSICQRTGVVDFDRIGR